MNVDIKYIADLITEDPDIVNKVVDKFDNESVLSYKAYLKVLNVLKQTLAKYGYKLEYKKLKVEPNPSGFTIKNISFSSLPEEAEDEEPSPEELMSTLQPPGELPPPGGGMGLPPLGEANDRKQELVDRLVQADDDQSIAATFDDQPYVNVYRAISGEFAKRVRDELGLDVSHQYIAKPPGSKDDITVPMCTVTLPKVRTATEKEPEESPLPQLEPPPEEDISPGLEEPLEEPEEIIEIPMPEELEEPRGVRRESLEWRLKQILD